MAEVIGVIGAGTMGNGIAQVCARAGYEVVMRDVSDEFLQRGLAAIERFGPGGIACSPGGGAR